jgi:hypothetical protein
MHGKKPPSPWGFSVIILRTSGAWDFLRSFWHRTKTMPGLRVRSAASVSQVKKPRRGDARVSSADLRYPRQTLWADYSSRRGGRPAVRRPSAALDVNPLAGLFPVAGFLPLLFLAQPALRHRHAYLGAGHATAPTDRPARLVGMERLDRL